MTELTIRNNFANIQLHSVARNEDNVPAYSHWNRKYNLNNTMTTKTILAPGHHPWPEGAGMIYMGMSPWDGMWKNRHQLMSRFARQMPVLYVEPPHRLRRLRQRVLSGQISWSDFRKPELREVQSNLYVLPISAFYPVSGSGILHQLTAKRWRRALYSAARQIGIRRPILWISRPEQSPVIGEAGEILSIYHAVDEYSGYTGQNSDKLEKLRVSEQRVLDSVDLIIVVSPELLRSKSGLHRDVRLVENAVDMSKFDAARISATPPPEFANISGPRLGYSGLIGKRLNFDLILQLAQRRAEWSFVFIGRVDRRECDTELSALERMDNVFFLGEKKQGWVADYVAAFDIGLLPYKLNVETKHISPLKMYEYLAVGLPVVSTAIPAALRHRDVIEVADNDTEFENACQAVILNEDSERIDERLKFAADNTWDHRILELTEIISSVLHRNGL